MVRRRDFLGGLGLCVAGVGGVVSYQASGQPTRATVAKTVEPTGEIERLVFYQSGVVDIHTPSDMADGCTAVEIYHADTHRGYGEFELPADGPLTVNLKEHLDGDGPYTTHTFKFKLAGDTCPYRGGRVNVVVPDSYVATD